MSKKIDTIVNKLKNLTFLETTELLETIEKIFGIDTSSMMFTAPVVEGSVATIETIEEKTSFDITLTEISTDKKIAILKIVRNVTGLGLKESKEIVDNIPRVIKEGVSKEESESIKKEIEAVGGKVLIK